MNSFLLRILVLLPSCLFFQEYRSQCYSAPSYCTSFSSQVTGAYNYGFTNITIGSINNTTSPNASGNSIYQDYTSLSTTSTAGSTISGSFTYNNWGSVRVFVDWNNDGVFNTSGTELCFTNTTINPNTTTSFTITVPSGQAIGSYRVRVAGDYWGSTVTPCGPLVYPGEVEDYTILLPNATLDAVASNVVTPSVLITSPVSNTMSFSIQNISSTTITSVNAGYTVNGGTAVTQSFTGLSIAVGASHTLTFSTGLTTATLGNYQLRFFISSLNGGSSTPTPLNDTICKTSALVCTGPLSGSYTINASSALSATNFPSFTLAAAALANCGISGPVLFNVAAGTYNEAVTISAVTGSSAVNTITFDGGNGNKDTRIITFPTSAASMSVVRLQNTRNITLRNLTIRSTGTTDGNIVHFFNDSNDRVNNCTIEFPSGTTNSNANVVVVSGIDRNTNSNTCRNIIIDSNTINNGSAGIYMAVSPSTFTNHILYNTINNSNGYGIYFQGQAALKIRHNTINLLISSSSKSGIFINGTTTPSSPLFHDFSHNKIYNVTYSGMHLVYMMTSASNRTLISNNFIGNFNPISSQGYKGIRLNNCTFMNIFHNSINCNAIPLNTSSDVSAALFSENSSTNNDVRNNQLVCTAPSGNLFPVHAPSSAPFSTLNYNNYFNSGSEELLSIGGMVLNSTNYKTAAPFNGGANSVSENPAFISSSDLHTINPCLLGVSGTGVTTDIDLQTRSSTPTIGADEILSIPTNDLGVLSITSPNFPLATGSNTVTVVLKNYGSNTITSATVNYKLNSGAVISQAWTGSLASCASTSFSFTTPATISGGSNTFICYTSSPNGSADNQSLNDTARWTLCNALSGVYTLGFGGDYPTFNSAISALSCGGLGGAVTFNVLPGTYDTYINIPNIRGSSATNTILIQPSNGLDSSVIIKPTTFQNSGFIVQLNGVDYLTFNKIAVVASIGNTMHGIRFGNNSNFITISNCIVHHTHANGFNNDGISHVNTSDMNITITSNRIYGGRNGITCYSFNTPPIRNYNISNNTCINQTTYGIYFAYGDSTKVNNNNVSSNQPDYQYGIKFDANRVGGEMRNNRVLLTNANRTSQSYGIITYNFNYQSSGIRGLIANNMVSISGTGNYRGFSIEATTPNTDVYHNTVSMMSNHASGAGIWLDATSSTSNFRNNIFQNTGGGLAIRTSGGSGVFSHNNYFSSGTNLANNSGTNYTALSTYQTATSQHANSLNKRIRFASASDLSTISPCIGNAGMNLTSLVPLDINNLTRASTPDIGAVEFSNSAVEAGLLNIISPLTSATPGSTCTVTATIINNGSSPITSLDLNYIIGASNASQSFTTSSGIPAGGILPCDTLNLSFTTTFTLASTHRRLRVFISSVNSVTDASQTNDTLIAKLCTTAATTSISQSICHGASFFFKGANRTIAGTYIDTLSTSVGCDSIITLTLTVLANTTYTSTPVFNSTGGGVDTIKVCSGSNVTLIGAGATTYAWSGPQTITNNTAFSAISSGLYTVTGTSGACTNTKTVYVQIFALPTLSYTSTPAFSSTGGGVDTIKVCSGTNITLTGGGANTHVWSGPQSVSDNTVFTALVSGRYTLTGTSTNSCVNTRSVFVSLAHPALVISSSAGALISGTYVSTYAGSGASGPLGSVSFNNPSNMCYDKSKNIYVVDMSNRVFKITPSGTMTTYAGTGASGGIDGAALSATFNGPFDIVADTADNLYIGENWGNRIRKISNTGIVTTLAGSGTAGFADGTGTAAQFNGIMGLCIDPQGNLYAADNSGDRIRKITPAGVVTTIAGSGVYTSVDGVGTAASFMRPHALCIDSSGNLYVGEGHGNKIRKITPSGVVTTIAGTGVAGSADGTASISTWNHPIGIKLDADGNLIVVDFGNHKIRKITMSTGVVTTIAGTGSSGTTNGTLASSTFTSPWGILIDPQGNLFIADRGSGRLRKINQGADTAIVCAGTSVTFTSTGAASYSWTGPQAVTNGVPFTVSTQGQYTVSGTGSNGCISEKNVHVKLFEVGYSSSPVFSSTGGGVDTIKVCIGNSVTLTGSGAASYTWSGPQTISNGTPFTVTTSGNYTVSGTSVSGCVSTKVIRIQLLTTPSLTLTTSPVSVIGNPTSTVTTFAGSGSAGSADAAGITASFNVPASVAIDGGGNIYVADQNNHKIRKISPAGAVTTFAGSGTAGSTDASGTAASFRNPAGVAVDAGGHVYVADQYNHKIRKISPAGVVTTMAGSGTAGSTNATGTSASFNYPSGIAVDGSGNVYVGDYFNHRIRKISPAGVVTTLAGSGVVGSTDATGTSASFNRPNGVVVDGGGNVYVADQFNHRIRKISPAGVVTTIAGSGSAGSTDATGTAASFNSPSGIAIDGGDNIYVADFSNNRIRKISPTGVVTTLAGSGSSGSTDATGTAASFSNPCHLVLDGGGNIYIADYSNNKIRKIAISTNPDTVKVCTGGNATLTGTGAVSYAWSGPQAITNNVSFGVTASGGYTVTGTASSSCTSTKQVFVLLNTLPSVSYTSTPAYSSTGGGVDTIVGINGNSLLLSGSGANTYSWSGPQSITNGVSFVASSSGEYTVTGTGAGGCTNTKKVYVKLITIALNLASSSNNGIKFVRKANVGSFIYYGDASNYYFAIDTSGITSGSLTGDSVSIQVNTTIDSFKSSNGANQEHAMFLMPRYWDAKGSFTGTVKVRFPYLPSDTATLTTLRDSAWARLKRTNTNTLAVKTSKIEWFKTVSVPYTAAYISGIVGNKFPSTIVKPSVTYGVTAGGVNYVELGEITSFSGGGAGIGFGPGSGGGGVGLPVTWASFDVKTLESGNELIWKTASEKNTDYFEVEYSYDAKKFLVAGSQLQAAGNSASLKSYNFTHPDFSSFVYYRIKQVDLDGQFDYSAIKLAKRAKGKEFIVSVYPTQIPENGRITIEAKNIDQSQMNLSMVDVTGKLVYSNSYIPNTNSLREVIDLINLQSGVYFIEISNGQGREVVKVVK